MLMRRVNRRLLTLVAFALLTVLVAACGGSSSSSSSSSSSAPESNPTGDIPDSTQFVDYHDPAGRFSFQYPEGWSRTDTSGVVAFTDKLNSIQVEVVDASSAPTASTATATEVPAIKAASTGYEPGKVNIVTRTSGPAVLITYKADSAPDPVTGKVIHLEVERYEYWKAGKQVNLTLSGPVGADNVDPWKTVTDSFRWM